MSPTEMPLATELPVEEVAEAAAESEPTTFFQGWPTVLTLVLLVVLGIALYLFFRKSPKGKKLFTTRMVATGAICISLSFVLSSIRLFHMPQGGSVTPASMLPLLLFAYTYGALPSLLVSGIYGILQLLQDAWIVSPVQALLDYVIAYMGISLCGLSRKLPEKIGYIVGISTTGLWRYACSVLSGVVFFASYAPIGQTAFAYSSAYNSVLLVDTAICLVLMMIPQVRGVMKRISGASHA